MARALVIVESVAKATRIQGMLGPDYIVRASVVCDFSLKIDSDIAPTGAIANG